MIGLTHLVDLTTVQAPTNQVPRFSPNFRPISDEKHNELLLLFKSQCITPLFAHRSRESKATSEFTGCNPAVTKITIAPGH